MEEKKEFLTDDYYQNLYLTESVLNSLVQAYQNALSRKIKISLTAAIKSTVKEISKLFED